MNKKWLSCLAVGMLLATGCNDPEPPQAQVQALGNTGANQNQLMDRLGHGLVGHGPLNDLSYNRKHVSYVQESEFNRGTSYITPQSARRTLESDQQLIHDIIEGEHGMDAGMVILAGSHAFVNVTPPKDMDADDKKKEMGKLKRSLLLEVPRYRVHITEKDA
ncbi:hypothetical protein [Halalkalibacter akibai]|uniref:Uncharacterized protein n=1 Tax=Halalkalibacter akibai (strain ATCC 43226 / DSM 21942 / CIP 109018 / JCM 9157 / 1139) TaxID=1236973 RepID=W4QPN0_HALA3|nr:hypothetical protein [Halalkalibacter akibai]GAE33618.1 hypothetical protein JCM9157_634 [Halalkalibacter akibai JCM 9157]